MLILTGKFGKILLLENLAEKVLNVLLLLIISYFSCFTLLVLNASFFGGKINERSRLENASNLTHEFLNENFNKRKFQNFLVRIVIQSLMCQIFLLFQDEMAHLFFRAKIYEN